MPVSSLNFMTLLSRVFTCLVALGSLTSSVLAQENRSEAAELRTLANKLASISVIRANFLQEKRIPALSKPLVSKGVFLYAKQRGILWQTVSPLSSLFVITPAAVLRRDENGAFARIDAQSNPVAKGFSSVFLSLFDGDIEKLSSAFEVHCQSLAESNSSGKSSTSRSSTGQWQLELLAKSNMQRFLTRLQLIGNNGVDKISISEPNGDHTEISFEAQSDSAQDLTEAELAPFLGSSPS